MPVINLGKKRKRIVTVNKAAYQAVYQTTRWKLLRASKFANNPLCEDCYMVGRVKQADEIHHRVPFDIGSGTIELYELAYNYDNLVSLCVECHRKRHIILQKGYRESTYIQ